MCSWYSHSKRKPTAAGRHGPCRILFKCYQLQGHLTEERLCGGSRSQLILRKANEIFENYVFTFLIGIYKKRHYITSVIEFINKEIMLLHFQQEFISNETKACVQLQSHQTHHFLWHNFTTIPFSLA